MNANLSALLYLVAGVLFIMSLRGLSSPASSRQGNFFGMVGMAIAVGTTLAAHPPADAIGWILVILGIAIGGGIGAVIAKRVPMTSMPELVAAFHSLVGMAAVLVAAGAFAAFLSTSSGLTIAVAGALSQDVLGRSARVRRWGGVRSFQVAAGIAVALPLVVTLLSDGVGVARAVGLAFSFASSDGDKSCSKSALDLPYAQCEKARRVRSKCSLPSNSTAALA